MFLCRLNLSEFKMQFCVTLKRRIFSSEDKSLDPKSKSLIYASLSKNGNVAGCREGGMIFLIVTSSFSR